MSNRATGPPEIRPYDDDVMAGRPTTREPTEFGARLIALRNDRGFSQTELARRSGVPQQRITYYERRGRSPAVDVVVKLATALGVEVEALASSKDTTEKKPGPRSQLDERVERIRRLSRREQSQVIDVIDALLLKYESASDSHP
jgi:transcriptional regulator with XRE-family HTH domain